MRFECQGRAPLDDIKEGGLRKALLSLKSSGPCSFASLTDEAGNYVQVAGGGVTCMLERYSASAGERLRAFHDKPSTVFPDGTQLVFGAGRIPIRADEWFKSDQVVEVFLAFLEGGQMPDDVHWRDAPGSKPSSA